MKTFIVLLSIVAAGHLETHTYKFSLPPCEPGRSALIQSPQDYVAVLMQCVRGPDGKVRWVPAPRGPAGPPDNPKKEL